MHEGPRFQILEGQEQGMLLRNGMTIALEPMVLIGTSETRVMPDEWTVDLEDRSLTAHFEHSIAITENGPVILTCM